MHTDLYCSVNTDAFSEHLPAGEHQACVSHALTQSPLLPVWEAPSSPHFLLSGRFLLPQSSFPRSLSYLLKEMGTDQHRVLH